MTADRAHEVSLDQVRDVVITIRSAKNDEHGCGNRLCFSKTSIIDNARAYDLVTDMFLWAQRATGAKRSVLFLQAREMVANL